MIGTILNIATVLIGGTLGILLGTRLPQRLQKTVIAGLGLFTFSYGTYLFFETDNPLIVLCSLALGGILGEWWNIENGLSKVGLFLERRITKYETRSKNFVQGFLTASLVFCVGPMTILGSIQDGLTGDYQLLATKAIMDGFAALVFGSTLGIGVIFSVLVILIYQGSISILAGQLSLFVTEAMMSELTATGGILLIGIAISSLLDIKSIRVSNLLPALLIAPIIVLIAEYWF